MPQTSISTEIARIVTACYVFPKRPRRISLRAVREAVGIPCTAEGMAQVKEEAIATMDGLMKDGIVTWYQVTTMVEDGPEWIRFTIPPVYARAKDLPEAAPNAVL